MTRSLKVQSFIRVYPETGCEVDDEVSKRENTVETVVSTVLCDRQNNGQETSAEPECTKLPVQSPEPVFTRWSETRERSIAPQPYTETEEQNKETSFRVLRRV